MLMVVATQCQGHRPATTRRVYGACHLLWQLDDESPALLLLLPRAALEGVITFSLTAVPQVQLQQLQLLLLLHVVAVVVLQVMPFPMTNCLAISVQRQKRKAFCPAASLMINFPKQIARPLTMTKKLKKPLEKRLSGRVSWTRMCSAKSKSICNFNLQFYFGLDTATAINIAAARQRQK